MILERGSGLISNSSLLMEIVKVFLFYSYIPR
jgi:hypothetical protein